MPLKKSKKLISWCKNQLQIHYYLNLSPEQISVAQRKFLVRTLSNAALDVPFYKKLLNGKKVDISNCFALLYSLPIVSKSDLRNDKSRIASYVDNSWKSWHNTGGSTGQPLHFPTGGE